MKRKTHEKRCLYWYKALVLILTVCLIGCQDDKIGSNGYDPSKPVVFSDFTSRPFRRRAIRKSSSSAVQWDMPSFFR